MVTNYTKLQRNMLVACAAIMIIYVSLVYFVVPGLLWELTTIHIVLGVATVMFLWIGGASKVVAYIALGLSLLGAGTALALMLWYFTILSNLTNG
jgi:hypothetical protein